MQLVMEMMQRCCVRYDGVLGLRQRCKAQHYTPVCGTTSWQVGHTVAIIHRLWQTVDSNIDRPSQT
jgi:hypothetical protein